MKKLKNNFSSLCLRVTCRWGFVHKRDTIVKWKNCLLTSWTRIHQQLPILYLKNEMRTQPLNFFRTVVDYMCLHPYIFKKLKSLSVLRRNLLWGEQWHRGAGSQLHHQQHGWGGGKCSSHTAQQQGIPQHSAHVYRLMLSLLSDNFHDNSKLSRFYCSRMDPQN